ncbi:MAG: cbb3-type cytochrome c oxidase N-terminal domain-containing protein [Flavipsychrobacter sp.]|nr:cbb3-type cytochrome c oxidase N-terminal domain-containing protein [Flavipsychrobacter sp.]
MRTYFNKTIALATALLVPVAMQAEGTAPAATSGDNFSFNPVLFGLVTLMLILVFAIGVIANVFRQLVLVYRGKLWDQKDKNSEVVKTDVIKAILLLVAFCIPALHSLAAEATAAPAAAAPVSNFINGIPKDQFYVLMSVIGLELFILLVLTYYVRTMIALLSSKPELAPVTKAILRKSVWERYFWDKFNNAVSVEKERDILLDHDYDGIQELDNSLPPWWKYGFILTIIVACIYFYRYQISGTGPNPQQEYAAEMKQADEDKAEYLAKSANNVDENTVKELTAASDIAAGQQIFQTTCFPCHAKDGGGGVGPNLTDDYWLHGGGIKDVFKSIKYGWQDKGMKSWKDDFSPMQIAQIASYVKTLHGTKPAAPKDKQGELYIESSTPKTDSTSKVAKN